MDTLPPMNLSALSALLLWGGYSIARERTDVNRYTNTGHVVFLTFLRRPRRSAAVLWTRVANGNCRTAVFRLLAGRQQQYCRYRFGGGGIALGDT